MRKAMISQPMAGKTNKQILEQRDKAIKALKDMGYEVVDSYFDDEWSKPENMEKRGIVNIPLCFLAKSLEKMSECDAVYFCEGWENTRGCNIEHGVAFAYGLKIIYENNSAS